MWKHQIGFGQILVTGLEVVEFYLQEREKEAIMDAKNAHAGYKLKQY